MKNISNLFYIYLLALCFVSQVCHHCILLYESRRPEKCKFGWIHHPTTSYRREI